MDQTVLLTQNIKEFFEAKKNAGGVFVCLRAAYDYSLELRSHLQDAETFPPNKYMAQMILDLIQNRSFSDTTGDSRRAGFDV